MRDAFSGISHVKKLIGHETTFAAPKEAPLLWAMFPVRIVRAQDGARVYLTGYIGDEATFTSLREQLAAIPENEPISIFINSGGGDVYEGFAMIELVNEHKGTKTAYIAGVCASMATLVALACDHIIMGENASWMIHFPKMGMFGDADSLDAAAIQLRNMNEKFLALYKKRYTGSRKELIDLMKSEKMLNAKEAKELGFVDEVQKMKMAAFYPDDKTPTPTNKKDMKELAAQIAVLLGLNPEASNEGILNAVKGIKEKADKHDELQARLERIEATTKDAEKAEVEATFEAALKDGRVTAEQKTVILAMKPADAKTFLDAAPKRDGKPRLHAAINPNAGPGAAAEDRSKWTMHDWMKNDMPGLHTMKAEDKTRYEALCKAAGVNIA